MKNLKTIIATAIITLSISCTNSQSFKSVDAAEFKAIAIIADVNGLKSIPKNILEPAYIIKICNSIGVPLTISI